METAEYKQYIVEKKSFEWPKSDTYMVWEPIKRGRYYREVKMFKGKLYGKVGTKYPYIKKIKQMSEAEHREYKKWLNERCYQTAYEIVDTCYPEIVEEGRYMLLEGEVIIYKQ